MKRSRITAPTTTSSEATIEIQRLEKAHVGALEGTPERVPGPRKDVRPRQELPHIEQDGSGREGRGREF